MEEEKYIVSKFRQNLLDLFDEYAKAFKPKLETYIELHKSIITKIIKHPLICKLINFKHYNCYDLLGNLCPVYIVNKILRMINGYLGVPYDLPGNYDYNVLKKIIDDVQEFKEIKILSDEISDMFMECNYSTSNGRRVIIIMNRIIDCSRNWSNRIIDSTDMGKAIFSVKPIDDEDRLTDYEDDLITHVTGQVAYYKLYDQDRKLCYDFSNVLETVKIFIKSVKI